MKNSSIQYVSTITWTIPALWEFISREPDLVLEVEGQSGKSSLKEWCSDWDLKNAWELTRWRIQREKSPVPGSGASLCYACRTGQGLSEEFKVSLCAWTQNAEGMVHEGTSVLQSRKTSQSLCSSSTYLLHWCSSLHLGLQLGSCWWFSPVPGEQLKPKGSLENEGDLLGEGRALGVDFCRPAPPQVTLCLKETPLSPGASSIVHLSLWGGRRPGRGGLSGVGVTVCTCCYLHPTPAEHCTLISSPRQFFLP